MTAPRFIAQGLLGETLRKPCLIEQVEGCIVVEPLRYFAMIVPHEGDDWPLSRLPTMIDSITLELAEQASFEIAERRFALAHQATPSPSVTREGGE